MKKHSRMAICFVFVLIFLFSVAGCAENTLLALDSRNVTEEELTLLNDPGIPGSFPLKLYSSAGFLAYSLADNVEIQPIVEGARKLMYIRTDLVLSIIHNGKAISLSVFGTARAKPLLFLSRM